VSTILTKVQENLKIEIPLIKNVFMATIFFNNRFINQSIVLQSGYHGLATGSFNAFVSLSIHKFKACKAGISISWVWLC
jgi:hypothetical protein